ncbi:exodeoxyribonuclease III [Polyangium sp. 15x6]|uniref:exodeoxyribonuclease III n=1 Tax=Polyangium sp. 15x6 TaxID=3042687 RepID=UPI00249BC533|nr:exodeoxyribonuclease III [Polyangium sp. 15x6]MDI3287574.1 exodeoxyribonuclease III [Polyangium sp. 15x6]
MKIVSWNVNGLRSVLGKGFCTWLANVQADIVGIQEVRAQEAQLGPCLESIGGAWLRAFSAAERPGYSGVGLLSRLPADRISTSLKDEAFDAEGRVQIARYGRLTLANVYFPNGSGPNRDNSRIPFKLAFYRRLFDVLEARRRRGEPILVMGDFNTAHREIDLARPKDNVKTSGFTPEEREELDRWIRAGYVDTFRVFEPGPGHYSWWSQRFGVRAKNVGWRIDYVLASEGAAKHLKGAFLSPHVTGSDHCPVGVEVDDAIVG